MDRAAALSACFPSAWFDLFVGCGRRFVSRGDAATLCTLGTVAITARDEWMCSPMLVVTVSSDERKGGLGAVGTVAEGAAAKPQLTVGGVPRTAATRVHDEEAPRGVVASGLNSVTQSIGQHRRRGYGER